MHMFRHNHVTIDAETIMAATLLQRFLKNHFRGSLTKQGEATITTERNEVQLLRFVKSSQSPGQAKSIQQ